MAKRIGCGAGGDTQCVAIQAVAARDSTPAAEAARERQPSWRREGSGRVSDGTATAPPSATHFNSRNKSRADCQRSSGSLSRQVLTIWSRAAGATCCTCEIAGGSSFRIAPSRLARLFPSNAFRPVTISKNTAPNAKISVRGSASSPSICSGAMYRNVPRIVPCAVTFAGVVGAIEPETATTGAVVFARPKSRSLACGGFACRCLARERYFQA